MKRYFTDTLPVAEVPLGDCEPSNSTQTKEDQKPTRYSAMVKWMRRDGDEMVQKFANEGDYQIVLLNSSIEHYNQFLADYMGCRKYDGSKDRNSGDPVVLEAGDSCLYMKVSNNWMPTLYQRIDNPQIVKKK